MFSKEIFLLFLFFTDCKIRCAEWSTFLYFEKFFQVKNDTPFAAVKHENFFMKFVSLFQYDDEKKGKKHRLDFSFLLHQNILCFSFVNLNKRIFSSMNKYFQ